MKNPPSSLPKKWASLLLSILMTAFMFQWEILQVGAWASMIKDYSKGSNVTQAIQETFSGEKPCAMCKKLTTAKTKPTSGCAFSLPVAMPPDLAISENFVLFPPSEVAYIYLSSAEKPIKQLTIQPPVPPPRFSFS